ncbi:DUF2953 domain-containing protein [Aceticella autotrophica]|uniref:DUF2953 domain-containing protein n=1 Tax=Aceticella autotrophica TaxID=2755338 RepID=A0A974Y2N2_9THEO|nr:DUF2953 domain-containing protein [Aceticella autotrophica]QSZ26478.1 DUF2953 domain-containing protein [Aceticella autotrophica]
MLFRIRLGYFNIYYKGVGENNRFEITIRTIFNIKLFNLIIDVADLSLKEKKPVIKYNLYTKFLFRLIHKKNKKKIFSFKDMKNILHIFKGNYCDFYVLTMNILNNIKFRKFNLSLEAGFSDASLTAILFGVINGIIYTALSLIYNNAKFTKEPLISIKPHYGKSLIDSSFICILDFRCGNIIIDGINFLRKFKI